MEKENTDQLPSDPEQRHSLGLYEPSFEKDACGIGLLAKVSGEPSHQIIRDGLAMLLAMDHRGARGCEPDTGDGAGIMCAMPDSFFRKIVREKLGAELPPPGEYGVGMVFLPTAECARNTCKDALEKYVEVQGQKLVGWRTVPTRTEVAGIGRTARLKEPVIEQVFIAAREGCGRKEFARQLYLIRKQAYHSLQDEGGQIMDGYYMASFSESTVVYKGQLTAGQLPHYFPDLNDSDFESHLAIVHSRFSTNTFPSWDRAQPMRYISHNGEINTLKGNVNWAKARESLMSSPLFGEEFDKLLPIVDPVTSDSGMFDNVLELLTLSGRSLPEAMMMMIPEAWEANDGLSEELKSFYRFNSCLIEPWDGPAAVTFADGRYAGVALDRNGLRPCRYCVTTDGRLIVGSEAGTLGLGPELLLKKGRIAPGKMLLVDFKERRIVSDEEIKATAALKHDYCHWLQSNATSLDDQTKGQALCDTYCGSLISRLIAFGYTRETLDFMLLPLVREGRDPVGSMGTDTPIAALSRQPRLVFDYLKQLFAQVTNPPIDPIREDNVMSLECFVGPEGNILAPSPESCRRLLLRHPVLKFDEMQAIKSFGAGRLTGASHTVDSAPPRLNSSSVEAKCSTLSPEDAWKTKILDATMSVGSDLRQKLLHLALGAKSAVEDGYAFIVLSDRNVNEKRIHVPSLLACGAVHHFLLQSGLRTKVGLFVETGEAREVHHFCCLLGFGADGVHPYLAHECLVNAVAAGRIEGSARNALYSYRKAVEKGVLKVLAKLGISTLQSYKGAQAFEALGLASEVVDLCLAGTPTRISGHGFKKIKDSLVRLHSMGLDSPNVLGNMGEFHWRDKGEEHMWNPETIASLQAAARSGDASAYERFAELANAANSGCTIRSLLGFRKAAPVALAEVEDEAMIVRRFSSGAMSFGSISKETHETLAIAMNRIGGKSNTGEGGEDSARFQADANGDRRRSAIKQVASGRFGVTIQYLTNADEIQIKMAQGAKPGEGGELPGAKIGEEIAAIRCSTPGVGLISPPPHHDIYSIEDLAQLIYDLKCANPSARISVKLVSEVGVGVVAAGVAKAHAGHILISGHDGGTGASPLTSIKSAGLPWELGLAETHQTLVLNGLRNRVRIQTDGQMKTGRDVAIAALLGADEIGFSTAPLIALGCIMMRKCHLNTCPVGIATQDPVLRANFKGEPEQVINYLFMVARDLRQIMANLGFRSFEEMVGRSDMLTFDPQSPAAVASNLDLTRVIERVQEGEVPKSPDRVLNNSTESDSADAFVLSLPPEESLNEAIVSAACQAIHQGQAVRMSFRIRNTDRTVGTLLSHEIARVHPNLLPDDTVHIELRGTAGQSLGAWLAKGVTIELEGETNDYPGKGLSGGRLAVYPPRQSLYRPQDSVIAGNAALYGATSGEAFFSGMACERFAVRNSGALAVVEGVGDHGCEYMTGGRVVVLGQIGRNFGAGMSGGISYIFPSKIGSFNLGTVDLETLTDVEEIEEVRVLIEKHLKLTSSEVAAQVLSDWPAAVGSCIKVMPQDYSRALHEAQVDQARSLPRAIENESPAIHNTQSGAHKAKVRRHNTQSITVGFRGSA